VAVKPEHGIECLFAPRRTVLDRLLVDAARKVGAEVRHGIALSEVEYAANGRIVGVTLKDASGSRATIGTDIVIGADGRQSTVARLVNARTYVQGCNASGIVFGLSHGYQGWRMMVVIAVYGAMFGVMAHLRRSLRPGMMAHATQDAVAGVLLYFIARS